MSVPHDYRDRRPPSLEPINRVGNGSKRRCFRAQLQMRKLPRTHEQRECHERRPSLLVVAAHERAHGHMEFSQLRGLGLRRITAPWIFRLFFPSGMRNRCSGNIFVATGALKARHARGRVSGSLCCAPPTAHAQPSACGRPQGYKRTNRQTRSGDAPHASHDTSRRTLSLHSGAWTTGTRRRAFTFGGEGSAYLIPY